MPVMTAKKTNIDYLREFIVGNDEANEFLDGVVKDLDQLRSEVENASEESTDLEDQISNLKVEVRDLEGKNYRNYIDAGIGTIGWESDSLPLQSLMETLEEKLKKHSPLKIENLLNAL